MYVLAGMDRFWIDPPAPNDPAQSIPVWAAVVAQMQPLSRRVVRPFGRARIVISGATCNNIVAAVWGLVPAWATSGERRQVASRHMLLDSDLVPDSSVTGDLWQAIRPPRRCLVTASGWSAPAGTDAWAFAPEFPPLTFAGLQNQIHPDGSGPVYTFGVFYRPMPVSPYEGTQVPIVIREEDRTRWLRCSPSEARSLLRPPPMRIHSKLLRGTKAADVALYGNADQE